MIAPVSGVGGIVKTRLRRSQRLASERFDRFSLLQRRDEQREPVGSLRTFGQESVQGTGPGTPWSSTLTMM